MTLVVQPGGRFTVRGLTLQHRGLGGTFVLKAAVRVSSPDPEAATSLKTYLPFPKVVEVATNRDTTRVVSLGDLALGWPSTLPDAIYDLVVELLLSRSEMTDLTVYRLWLKDAVQQAQPSKVGLFRALSATFT